MYLLFYIFFGIPSLMFRRWTGCWVHQEVQIKQLLFIFITSHCCWVERSRGDLSLAGLQQRSFSDSFMLGKLFWCMNGLNSACFSCRFSQGIDAASPFYISLTVWFCSINGVAYFPILNCFFLYFLLIFGSGSHFITSSSMIFLF